MGEAARARAGVAWRPAPSPIAITGIGVVLPNCEDRGTLWEHLKHGRSQLRFDQRGDARLPVGAAAQFDPEQHFDGIPRHYYQRYPRQLQLYLASVLLAVKDSGTDLGTLPADRVGIFEGSARPFFHYWYDQIRSEKERAARYTKQHLMVGLPGQCGGIAASLLKLRGGVYSLTGACTSGAIAIGLGCRELMDGALDMVLASGHDVPLVDPIFEMYGDAGLLSTERHDARRAIRPYGGGSTNAFGEGAITFVLERVDSARARGREPITLIAGFKHGNIGDHPTGVDPSGARPAELVRELLDSTGHSVDEVDFVVGHGNAVSLSDQAEMRFMQRLFGARARSVPIISTKPIYGHTMGASTALNVAAAALMMHHAYLIPTINIDPHRPAEVFTQPNIGAPSASRLGLAMGYGLGGHCTALLLKKVDAC
jgi:3-oxoacyl-[acyl-carrier-protein] synthase II